MPCLRTSVLGLCEKAISYSTLRSKACHGWPRVPYRDTLREAQARPTLGILLSQLEPHHAWPPNLGTHNRGGGYTGSTHKSRPHGTPRFLRLDSRLRACQPAQANKGHLGILVERMVAASGRRVHPHQQRIPAPALQLSARHLAEAHVQSA